MNNKELKNIINNLENIIKVLDKNTIQEDSVENYCNISIKRNVNGKTKLDIKGDRLSLLLTLAGAEKGILQELDCDFGEFDLIREIVDTEEVKYNE